MIEYLIIIAIIGFILFLFNRFAPVDANVKAIINYAVIFIICLVVILFLLRLFGLYSGPNLNLR